MKYYFWNRYAAAIGLIVLLVAVAVIFPKLGLGLAIAGAAIGITAAVVLRQEKEMGVQSYRELQGELQRADGTLDRTRTLTAKDALVILAANGRKDAKPLDSIVAFLKSRHGGVDFTFESLDRDSDDMQSRIDELMAQAEAYSDRIDGNKKLKDAISPDLLAA